MTRSRAGIEWNDGVRLSPDRAPAPGEESAIQRQRTPRSGLGALSEESCIRKAVAERGLTPGPAGLVDTTAEDEAATGTAFAICRLNRWVKGASEAWYRPAAERGRRPNSSPSPARPEDSTASPAGTSDQRSQSRWGQWRRPTACRDRGLPHRGAV